MGEDDLPSSAVAGYAVAYPWPARQVAPIDTLLRALPADADTLYVHDVALLPAARGQGHAAGAVALLLAAARSRGLARLSLMAVYGAEAMWRRHGFAVVEGADLAGQLAPYGPQARYMERALG